MTAKIVNPEKPEKTASMRVSYYCIFKDWNILSAILQEKSLAS